MEKNTDFKPVLLSLINLLHLAVTSKNVTSFALPTRDSQRMWVLSPYRVVEKNYA